MPAKRRGAAAVESLHTARQALASNLTAAPHQLQLLQEVWTPRPLPARTPAHHALLAITGSAAVRQNEWEAPPSATLITRACTREQVRAQRSLLSPPRQCPSPGLTGGRDKREQLVQDTCPHPVSQGAHGPATGYTQGSRQSHRPCGAQEGGSEVNRGETPGKA